MSSIRADACDTGADGQASMPVNAGRGSSRVPRMRVPVSWRTPTPVGPLVQPGSKLAEAPPPPHRVIRGPWRAGRRRWQTSMPRVRVFSVGSSHWVRGDSLPCRLAPSLLLNAPANTPSPVACCGKGRRGCHPQTGPLSNQVLLAF